MCLPLFFVSNLKLFYMLDGEDQMGGGVGFAENQL